MRLMCEARILDSVRQATKLQRWHDFDSTGKCLPMLPHDQFKLSIEVLQFLCSNLICQPAQSSPQLGPVVYSYSAASKSSVTSCEPVTLDVAAAAGPDDSCVSADDACSESASVLTWFR